ncbi:MAG: N-acetylmuramoyl-L-alanine amidase LytC [Candidatus Dichloromethanomonas elyunquensis]|nr:MAG: N-acetylmuramoyl-L-alanine amidase LytC [Candidatus Dichloromethanomonas elyunquensis]
MKRTKKIAVLAIVIMVLTMLPIQMFAATADSDRLSGSGRVETSLDIASAGWTSASTIIVAPANQENLVDALAVAPLAGQENAPILLTFKDKLSSDVKAKISSLHASKVYVVGAISDSIKDEIAAMSGVTVEVLKGSNRWDTTKAINAKLINPAGTFVIGYAAIPDALSIASYAAKNKYAVILADVNGKIPDGQTALGSKTYIIGGPTLVSDITGATRIYGQDRFETNTKVFESLNFDNLRVYVANGLSLVDALSVAPLASKYNAFVALADANSVAAAASIKTKLNSSSLVIAVGGTSAVSDSVKDSVKPGAVTQFAVVSAEVVSLNQVKVVFNQEVNETNAENTANYIIGTTTLGVTDSAVMQPDNKRVLVTLGTPIDQGSNQTFSVSAGILNKAGDQIISKYTKQLTFNDVATPTVLSAKATGNKKVTVIFSEPVVMTNPLGAGVKLDGQSITAAGAGTISVKNDAANEGLSGDEAATRGAGGWWSNKLEINFNAALSAGNHSITIPAGTANVSYVDAAGFRVAETSIDFTVDNVTGNPTVKAVDAQDNGIVYVTFDRDMDTTTAGTNSVLLAANFSANTAGTNPTAAPTKVDSRNDKIKMTFASGVVKEGSNVLILDKDIKDAWGNKLSDGTDDIRYSFAATKDTTKPEVSSINLTGNESTGAKITVKFSEDIDGSFASSIINYNLKDSSGDVTSLAGATILNKNGATTSSDTWVITLAAGVSPLTDSSYTLEVKNMIDLASTPNRMDTIVKSFSVGDTVRPTLRAAYESTTANKVLVEYSEPMSASVTDLNNYYYLEAGGAIKSLPSGTTIFKESDKVVSIKFPNGVTVNPGGAGSDIVGIRATNAADLAGNTLAGGSADINLTTAGNVSKITINNRTVVATKVGDDIYVTFQTSEPLSTITLSEFGYGAAGNRKSPSSYTISGKDVTLKFLNTTNAGADVLAIKASGTTAALVVAVGGVDAGGAPVATTNADGRRIAQYATATAVIPVYDDQVAPEVTGRVVSGANTIDITFSEPVDSSVYGLYQDDFTFDMNGTLLTVQSVSQGATQNVLRYTFTVNITANVNVRAVADKIDIKDLKTDVAETQNLYIPTAADKANNII